MKYRYLNHGGPLEGTALEIVEHMHRDSLAPAKTTEVWMQEVARRALRMPGVVIRTDTPEQFLEDMTQAGLVKLEIIDEQST